MKMKGEKNKQGRWLYKQQFVTIGAAQAVDVPHGTEFQMYRMVNAAGKVMSILSEKQLGDIDNVSYNRVD